jgi:hypothetical protein
MRQATAIGLLVLASVLAAIGQGKKPTPPSYCNPCLFYGGDFDPNGPAPNALLNQETDSASATIYIPFAVPPNQTWTVAGFFSNNLVLGTPLLSPPQIEWSISTGISQGNGGTLIASGTAKATLTPTGRSWDGMNEYTALGRLNTNQLVTLTPGHYWMTAVPVCISECVVNFYMTDVEDVPPPQAKGLESTDESYWYAPFAGDIFAETGGTNGVCDTQGGPGDGCDKFSAGLLGTAQLN